jgi:hypothetical protein
MRLGVSLRPEARSDDLKRERVNKAMMLRKQGYSNKVIVSRCGSAMHQMKAWAAELGLEWIELTKGGKRL